MTYKEKLMQEHPEKDFQQVLEPGNGKGRKK